MQDPWTAQFWKTAWTVTATAIVAEAAIATSAITSHPLPHQVEAMSVKVREKQIVFY